MNKSRNILNQWLIATEDLESEMLSIEGSQKVKIEKGKYYFVFTVMYSGDNVIPVLIDVEENRAFYCLLDEKYFRLYDGDN